MAHARRIIVFSSLATCCLGLSAGMARAGSYPALWPVALLANAGFCVPAYVGLRRWNSPRQAVIMMCALGLYALIFEAAAVATGWPYGRFNYGPLLGPLLLGLVPPPVFFAWTPLFVGVYMLAAGIWHRAVRVAAVAVGLVVVDLVIDPGAVALGYWSWIRPGAYYGVPLVNFAGWLVSGGLAAAALAYVFKAAPPRAAVRSAGFGIVLILTLWTLVDAWRGLYVAAGIGAVALAVAIYVLPRKSRQGGSSVNRV